MRLTAREAFRDGPVWRSDGYRNWGLRRSRGDESGHSALCRHPVSATLRSQPPTAQGEQVHDRADQRPDPSRRTERHDPWETAEFYKQAVGLQEVTELDGPLAEGVFLTDGVVNLAILHFKTDEAAQGTGKDYVGIHHIGFWVDDVVEQGKIVRNTGATWIMGDPNNPTATR